MSQVTMTTATTTPPVTAVCSGALLITMMAMLASTSVSQQDVALSLQFIARDTITGSAGLTNMLQLQ